MCTPATTTTHGANNGLKVTSASTSLAGVAAGLTFCGSAGSTVFEYRV